MVNHTDNTGCMGRTKVQWILPEAREMSHMKIHNLMEHIISKETEGECYHFLHAL
jgi:hypothetical protein